jgi:hypothetical protein
MCSGRLSRMEDCQSGRSLGRPSLVNPIRAGQPSPSVSQVCGDIFGGQSKAIQDVGTIPQAAAKLPPRAPSNLATAVDERQAADAARRMRGSDKMPCVKWAFSQISPSFDPKSTGHPGRAFLRSATRSKASWRRQGRTSRARQLDLSKRLGGRSLLFSKASMPAMCQDHWRPKVMELAVAVAN